MIYFSSTVRKSSVKKSSKIALFIATTKSKFAASFSGFVLWEIKTAASERAAILNFLNSFKQAVIF